MSAIKTAWAGSNPTISAIGICYVATKTVEPRGDIARFLDEATESRLRAHFREPRRPFPPLGRLAFRERFNFPFPKLALQDDDFVGIAEAFSSFIYRALSHLDDVVLNPVDVRFVFDIRNADIAAQHRFRQLVELVGSLYPRFVTLLV